MGWWAYMGRQDICSSCWQFHHIFCSLCTLALYLCAPCNGTVWRRDASCVKSTHTGNTCLATHFLHVQYLSIYMEDNSSQPEYAWSVWLLSLCKPSLPHLWLALHSSMSNNSKPKRPGISWYKSLCICCTSFCFNALMHVMSYARMATGKQILQCYIDMETTLVWEPCYQ